jgi:hypothetical protein
MSLYNKNTFGRKYIRTVAGSPFPYLAFLACMVALFLYLALSTKVDRIRTYPVKWVDVNGAPVLAVESTAIPAGKAFLYSNKNEHVYPVHIRKTESSHNGVLLYLDGQPAEEIPGAMDAENLYLDVPQGKTTLLYFILVKGGKGGG